MDRTLTAAGTGWGEWLATIRVGESVMLQAFPVLGLLYAGSEPLRADPVAAVLLIFGLAVLYAHIFALNDWANIEEDLRDPRKADRTFRRRGVSDGAMRTLVILLGLGALLAFLFLPARTWPYGLWFLAAGVLYSHPLFAMKRVPLASSAIHLVSGTAHFLIGVSLYRLADRNALLVGLWCGLILAAGHLVQEVEDHAGDRGSEVRTHAVRFGQGPTFLAAFAAFTGSFVYLAALASAAVLPLRVAWLALLYPPLAYLFWRTWRRGLDPEEVFVLRVGYRLLFAGMILILATALWKR